MNPTQIAKLVEEKNTQRERTTLRQAENIIEGIVTEQKRITEAQTRIAEYRTELKQLEVEQLNIAAVLGEL